MNADEEKRKDRGCTRMDADEEVIFNFFILFASICYPIFLYLRQAFAVQLFLEVQK